MNKFLDENGLKHFSEKIKEKSVWEKGQGEHSTQTADTECVANGDYSVAEGYATIANNLSEHAEGRYNVSNSVDNSQYGNAGNTQHSIGIGADDINRKNAFEVMQNGDIYLIGVGDYDGTNVSEAGTIQEVINNKQESITDLDEIREGSALGKTAYQKPLNGIPKLDLSTSVQDSLNLADTALQNETDPTVPAWAKQPNKPSYTASEITDNGTNVAAEISVINEKISPQATSGNKLVSASEMGDAISSVEAKQLYATSSQGSFATKSALTSATTFYNADGTAAIPTKNDVAYILADESHDNKSAKYVVANVVGNAITWGFVITFSDTTFTQAQIDAINSNVTNAKRQSYDEHIANSDIHVTTTDKTNWNDKQDAISDLNEIRSGAALGATALQEVPNTYRTAAAQDVIDGNKLDKGSLLHKTITITYIDGTTVSEDVAIWKPQN